MKSLIIIYFLPLALLFSCGNGGEMIKEGRNEAKGSSYRPIPKNEKVTDLQLDSILIQAFIENQKIEKSTASRIQEFYLNRDYQFAWFTKEGLTEPAQWFWDLHKEYINYSQDSSSFDKSLHQEMEIIIDEGEESILSEEGIASTEMKLTAHFLDFSKSAFTGKINPSELQWHIPKKKLNYVSFLDSLVNMEGEFEDLVPQSRQYKAMKQQLLKYYDLSNKLSDQPISIEPLRSIRKGDSSEALAKIKTKLFILGDLPRLDTSTVFNTQLEGAVISFQERHGLKPDGIIGPMALRALNTPVAGRIQTMLLNMERMRWLPEHPEGRSIMVNIPEYRIRVFEGKKEALSMNIVVGKSANRTVIFKDQLEYVVFSPYWNIPRSITRNEILPAMKKNISYLHQNNMEIVRYSDGLPVIRQKPGPQNALGKVKFIFPNRYSIYFHDTPAKSLFDRTQRAFSHGCIRLEHPFRMAQYLLKDKQEWTDERIRAQMNADKEKWVQLEEKVPVRIVYFTSWVDSKGRLNFRDDIYGHDRKLSSLLFNTDSTF